MLYLIIRDERGQDLVEYGCLAAFISIAAVVTLKLFSEPINSFYQKVLEAFG